MPCRLEWLRSRARARAAAWPCARAALHCPAALLSFYPIKPKPVHTHGVAGADQSTAAAGPAHAPHCHALLPVRHVIEVVAAVPSAPLQGNPMRELPPRAG